MAHTNDAYVLFQQLVHELALFAVAGYLLAGIDELAVDLIWLVRAGWLRLVVPHRNRPLVIDSLPPVSGGVSFAVLVPAKNEAAVIGQMLNDALKAYAGKAVHVFVGCYPDDPGTASAAKPYEGEQVSIIVHGLAGKSTKAECLNEIYLAVREQERRSGQRFDGFILHDAEDMPDLDEIAVFEAFLSRHAMIQLPVIPLPDRNSRWISGHYCDEFAEAHGKVLIVRQALGAALPSAGVGCVIRRDAMERLASLSCGRPFAEDSLTEDYEIGLKLSGMGFSTAFLRVGRDGPRSHENYGVVATRAPFPDKFENAVKQKARWTAGIALSAWDRLGWGNSLAENWMRVRDRASVLAAVIAFVGYVAALLGIMLFAAWYFAEGRPFPFQQHVLFLAWLNGSILIWRLCCRFYFVARLYGLREAGRALPRIFVSSILAILAVRRAISLILEERRTGTVRWDKTEHKFRGASVVG